MKSLIELNEHEAGRLKSLVNDGLSILNQQGEFSTEGMKRDEIVFKCYAINDKNALRKYNKYKGGEQ